jgi:NTE family protein
MLAILIRHNTEQRKTPKNSDAHRPCARGFPFARFQPARWRCASAGSRARAVRVAARSGPPEEFQRIVDGRGARRSVLPKIDFLRVESGSERYASAIEALFSDQVGKPVNPAKLERRVGELYGQGNLEILDYRLVQSDPEKGDPPGHGLALNTAAIPGALTIFASGCTAGDFNGNSSFNAAARSTMAEITKYGGEWVVDLQLGETPRVATELYLPAGYRSRWFVMPHAQFEIRTVPLISDAGNILAEYRVRSTDFGLDLGRGLGNYGEIRVGAGRTVGSTHVRVGDKACFARGFRHARHLRELGHDTLDTVGTRATAPHSSWAGETSGVRQRYAAADLPVFDQSYAHSWGQHRYSLDQAARASTTNRPGTPYSLGGFLNMSGIAAALVGPHAIARGIYYPSGGARRAGVPQRRFTSAADRVGNVEHAARHFRRRAGPMAACSSARYLC